MKTVKHEPDWPYSVSPNGKFFGKVRGKWREMTWGELPDLIEKYPGDNIINLAYSYLEIYRQDKNKKEEEFE